MAFRSCAAAFVRFRCRLSHRCVPNGLSLEPAISGLDDVRLSDRLRPRKRGTQNINSQLARNDAHESGLVRGTTLVARTAAWPRHGLEEEASWPTRDRALFLATNARHLAGPLRNPAHPVRFLNRVTDSLAA